MKKAWVAAVKIISYTPMNPSYTTIGELPAVPYPSGSSTEVPTGETLIHVMRGDLVNNEFLPNANAGSFVFFKWKESYYQSQFEEFSTKTK